jgi:molybdate transport system ATP-binding protein
MRVLADVEVMILLSHHYLRVAGKRGAVALDVALDFQAPWTVIFGPSGSGKSSLLRAACGLLPRLESEFRRGEKDLSKTPVHLRKLAYAPQGAAVFPHLNVRENIEFSTRALGQEGTFIEEAIELFGLRSHLLRMPRDLSGGERQIVALARAFAVPGAALMLLDEPFSGVDRKTRDALLPRMRDRLKMLGIPAISVTHDVEEPLLLEAEVVRLEAGKVVARGPAREALEPEISVLQRILTPP